MSLSNLGQKKEACAALHRFAAEFPMPPTNLRRQAAIGEAEAGLLTRRCAKRLRRSTTRGIRPPMDRLGPFETAPHLAVAVSGGADSLALCLLAHRWAHARGGRIAALTVDHGLRREATAEATQVGAWLARSRNRPSYSAPGRRQAARPDPGSGARRRAIALLRDWCADHASAPSADRPSPRRPGGDPFAATGARQRPRRAGRHGRHRATPEIRLLRPLAFRTAAPPCGHACERCKQGWIQDPSNRNPRLSTRSFSPGLMPQCR